MLPIIAIANLVNGVLSGFLTLRLYRRYQRRMREHTPPAGVQYFIAFYFVLTIVWLLYSTPGLITTNLTWIMVFQSLADLFVLVGAAVVLNIVCFALHKPNLAVMLSLVVATCGVAYLFGLVFSHPPSIQEVIPPYVYWHPATPNWIRVVSGIVAALSSLTFISTFVVLGFKVKTNNLVRRRSFFLAAGMFFLFLASLTFFIFSTGGFLLTMSSSLLGVAGLFVMLRGVPYHDEHNEQMATYLKESTPS
ncbi:hypothetical protein COV04_02245 [Candidatus Uhrbacteria bacterium CG10_big_fil_rev_8_21_14_0_10_48_11]|uniref:Histidine kinase N-terminal 7TM region domain-containing protein n=1 Tax=Candidatus Uhrbacteria bacterium CG10_big_fil_rev_8_21_14_0_10_48_11 TaxID=1975037 RepID=A0A2M8LER8_9BACT|nr:MAG: hypothetical protein COV04_02245 [Candidatus Uhrbacteria bacterium CG10_big_fil_rev_8_21_14_0_10_48_11]